MDAQGTTERNDDVTMPGGNDMTRLIGPEQVGRMIGKSRHVAARLMRTKEIPSKDIAEPGKREQLRTTVWYVQTFIDSFASASAPTIVKKTHTTANNVRSTEVFQGSYREHRRSRR